MKFLKDKNYVSIGFMLFAMFFGAGNLIFPTILGQNAGTSFTPAMLGLIITGVGLPLLGVIVIGYSGARDLLDLSSRAGKVFGLLFTTSLYLSIGPLFAIPRTGATTYSLGLSSFISQENQQVGLYIFLVFFMGLTLLLSIKPNKLVDIIGKYITPVLLLSMFVLIIQSIISPMGSYQQPSKGYETFSTAFTNGLLEGYNTMDALASLVFGIIVINSVKLYGAKTTEEISKNTSRSAIIAAFLLGIIYIAIANIGATSVSAIGMQENGAVVLTEVTNYYYSSTGRILLLIIVFLACITTSVGLTTACASYFNRIFPKISYEAYVIGITVFSAVVGSVGLTALISLAVPVLVLLYPLTIAIIILGFTDKIFGGKKEVYTYTLIFVLLFSLYTTAVSTFGVSIPTIDKAIAYIPLNNYSFGWLAVAAVGFVFGLGVSRIKQK